MSDPYELYQQMLAEKQAAQQPPDVAATTPTPAPDPVDTPPDPATSTASPDATPPADAQHLATVHIDPSVPEEIKQAKDPDSIVKIIGKSLKNGFIKFAESTGSLTNQVMNKGLDVYDAATGQTNPANPRFDTEPKMDELKSPNPSVGGQLAEGATQYLISFIGAGKALEGLGWLRSGKPALDLARGFAQGAVADFTAFTGHSERLSDMLTKFENPMLNNAVTQYLSSKPGDTDMEGRLKNVLEGGGIGVLAEGMFGAIRGMKETKDALLAGDKTDAGKIMQSTKEQLGQWFDNNKAALSDYLDKANANAEANLTKTVTKEVPTGPITSAVVNANEASATTANLETEAKSGAFNTTADAGVTVDKPAPNMAEMSSKLFTDPAQAETAIGQFKTALKTDPEGMVKFLDGTIGGKINTDQFETTADAAAFSEYLGTARVPEFQSWSHDDQVAVAKAYGTDIETLKQYEKLGAVNSHVLLSSRVLLGSQAETVTQMIKKGATDEDVLREVAKYDEFLNMYTSFSNIAGRTLDAHKIRGLTPSLRKTVMEDYMQGKFGGVDQFNKFKTAWVQTDGDVGEIAALMKTPLSRKIGDTALEIWKNGILSGIKTFNVNFFGGVMNTVMQIPIRAFEGAAASARVALTGAEAGADRIYPGESLAMLAGELSNFGESLHASYRIAKTAIENKELPKFAAPQSLRDASESGFQRRVSSDYWGIGTVPGSLARFIQKMTNGAISDNLAQQTMKKVVDTAGSVINTPTNLLNIQDGWVQNMASRQQRWALAYRQATKEGVPFKQVGDRITELLQDDKFLAGSKESEEAFAKRVTFQDEMGPFGKNLAATIQSARPLGIPVLEFIMPFKRTPYNIFKQGVIDMNPVFGANQAVRAAMDPTMSGVEKDAVLGRYAFGSALSSYVASKVINGEITGAGPSDPAMKQNLMRSGWRPYAMKVQDGQDADGNPQFKYYQYNRLEPFSYLAGSVASAIETQHYMSMIDDKHDKGFWQYAAAVNNSLMEATLDKSFFTGVQEFFLLANDPTRYGERWSARFASSFVPAIEKDIETMLQKNPHIRDVSTVEDAIKSKMIGKSGEVPVVRNRWGDPVANDPGWFLGTRSYFSPVGMSDDYQEPADREITRLGVEGVETQDGMKVFKDALLTMPDRAINQNGVQIKLSPEQYSRLVEIAGKEVKLPKWPGKPPMTLRDAMNYLVTDSSVYKIAGKNGYPATQAFLIKNTAKGYDELARKQLISEYPDLENQVQKARSLNVTSKLGVIPSEESRAQIMRMLNGTH